MKIFLETEVINNLDLSPVKTEIEPLLAQKVIANYENQLQFVVNYHREPTDPREISEIPEVRLWFVRLDAYYPWLTFLLDAKSGELARYTAMLVPHQFHRTEGIQYNLEALEIFVMHKIFILSDWLKQEKIEGHFRLKSMAQMFGYEIDESFFISLDRG